MRAYRVFVDMDSMELVIADTAKEAKRIAWNCSEWLKDCAEDYTEVRVKWLKGNTEGMRKGISTDYIDAMERRFFDMVYEADCPRCGTQDTTVYYEDGRFYCYDCEENVIT